MIDSASKLQWRILNRGTPGTQNFRPSRGSHGRPLSRVLILFSCASRRSSIPIRCSMPRPRSVFASPTEFIRQRSGDGKDHFQCCLIALGSVNYVSQGGNGTDPLVMRETTRRPRRRTPYSFDPHMVSRPGRLCNDPILDGLLCDWRPGEDHPRPKPSLQINVGADQGETPTYPWVTAFSWVMEHDRQTTTLQLSDRHSEPQR